MTEANTLLFVEDEAPFREFAGGFLEENGFRVRYAASGGEALEIVERADLGLVLLDLNLPDLDGVDVLRWMRGRRPELRVIVLTAYRDAEHAVSALKAGAIDYLTKPVDLERLLQTARETLEGPRALTRPLPAGPPPAAAARELCGAHPAWLRAVACVDRAAAGGAPVLLLHGETGVGKSELARRFHRGSPRREGPLVVADCPTLAAALAASELFGAAADEGQDATGRRGLIERAAGGTLVLEEAGELPTEVQSQLLSLLERGSFRRVGGREEVRGDVQLVCTASRDLRQAVESGSFRRDLFFRLEALAVRVPPLRERGEDVLLLAEAFLPGRHLDEGARGALVEHPFPGNVRELKNLLERAATFAAERRELRLDDLDLPLAQPVGAPGGPPLLTPVDLEALLGAIEGHYVLLAADRTSSQREAGRLLGLDRFALARRRSRLERLGGRDGVRRVIDAAPAWVRALLGPHPADLPDGGLDLQRLRGELEATVIHRALRATQGNRARAATLIGMSRTSLCRRLDTP